MWAHYAQNGEGFALAYSVSSSEIARLYKVHYRERRSDFTVYFSKIANIALKIFDARLKRGGPLSGDQIRSLALQMIDGKFLMRELVSTKDTSWEKEQEWRLCAMFENEKEDHTKIRNARAKALYLGQNMLPNNRRRLINIAKKQRIPIYQIKTIIQPTECYLKPVPLQE